MTKLCTTTEVLQRDRRGRKGRKRDFKRGGKQRERLFSIQSIDRRFELVVVHHRPIQLQLASSSASSSFPCLVICDEQREAIRERCEEELHLRVFEGSKRKSAWFQPVEAIREDGAHLERL